MKNNKIYIFFISIIHFAFSLYCDKYVFVNDNYYYSLKYMFLKFIVFILIIIFWSFIFYLIKKLRGKDKFWINATKIFLIYFGIMLVILLLVWPGAWVWDEYFILELARRLEFVLWQNYLTSIFYMICMMIIPFPTGIIIVQLFVISIIVTYLISNIKVESKKKYLLLIPFFLPPVIFQNLYPMRLTLYAYLLVFTGSYILFNRNKEFRIRDILILSSLTSILAVWRSEGIMYLLLSPITVLVAYYKKIKLGKCCLFIILVVSLFAIIYFPQYNGTKNEYTYKLTSILNPLSMMLISDLKGYDEIKDELSEAINVDVLRDNASYTEIPAFWLYKQELIGGNFGKEQYETIKKNYLYLVIRNPLIFLGARFKTFFTTAGMNFERNYISDSGYDLLTSSNETIRSFVNNNIFTRPINNDIRRFVMYKIECRNQTDIYKVTWYYVVFWNLIVTFIFIPVYAVINIFRKKWAIVLMMIGLLLNAFAVFLAAPGVYFMYYFPMYLAANILITYELLKLFQKSRKGRNEL